LELTEEKPKGNVPSRLWVPAVIIIGGVVGTMIYLWLSSIPPFNYPLPFRQEIGLVKFQAYLALHTILSTVAISLLVALLVVYGRTYITTKANFMLGLVVMLYALLLQSVLSNPVFSILIDRTLFFPGFSSPLSDIFMVVAYAVFLYLSLE
jgi:hypothetical protein